MDVKATPTQSVVTAFDGLTPKNATIPVFIKNTANEFTVVESSDSQVKLQRVGLNREICETQLIKRSDLTTVWNKNERSPLSDRISYPQLSRNGNQITVSTSFNMFEEIGTAPNQGYYSDPVTVGLFIKSSNGGLLSNDIVLDGIGRVLGMILDVKSDGTLETNQATLTRLLSGVIRPADLS